MEFRFKVDVPRYVYPTGIAGKKFGEGLRAGKILVSYCTSCETGFMPPTAYCPHCYMEIKVFIEPEKIILGPYTTSKADGKIYALIKFEVRGEPVEGGIIHYVESEGDFLEQGVELEPIFKEAGERRGVITDILFFKPKA